MKIPSRFSFDSKPLATPEAVVQAGTVRFTVLSPRLVRMEYSPDGHFEDRPSQAIWFREQPVPHFQVERTAGVLEILTDALRVRYSEGQPFSTDTLSIEPLGTRIKWKYGMEQKENLLGTTRTLDQIDGATALEPGLLSKRGWSLLDDSRSLIFTEDYWLTAREKEGLDLYFFWYGKDYRAGLADFYRISGKPGLVPRWALGNWWSRFWSYSAEELGALMKEFRAKGVPLGVCIIDMDWHITNTGNASSGWTGYTWNRELFPDPPDFIQSLHEMGLKTGLNLHPAEGIWPHEEMYSQMALAMDQDPDSKQPVRFDPENPQFIEAYLKYLHHPKEEEGIDFWWMDWQQGNPSTLPGLNLLWWINHIHYLDAGREPGKRSFLFSRWGGLGNHRYPIGFSGDTFISWASLAFQPYMTATAANVGYSWWSHDIGGHMGGREDGELYARWVQFGAFSPILRLHSTKNAVHERRPWGFDERVEAAANTAMRLRHRLIPYIYSMAWKDHQEGLPLVRPLYHLAPENDEAYASPNVYTFGTELLAAPYTSPIEPKTNLARQVAWLPGTGTDWFGFFDSRHYAGGCWHALYGGLKDIPVFARPGAIVPLAPEVPWGGINIPDELEVHIFPGAANRFELFEDDGETQAYANGEYALTTLEQDWEEGKQVLRIDKASGKPHLLPAQRLWKLVFRCVLPAERVSVRLNGKEIELRAVYDDKMRAIRLDGIKLGTEDELEVILLGSGVVRQDWKASEVKRLAGAFSLNTEAKGALVMEANELAADPFRLADFAAGLEREQLRALLEVLTGAGLDKRSPTGEVQVIVWNNDDLPQIRFLHAQDRLLLFQPALRFVSQSELGARSRIYLPEKEMARSKALWAMDYGGVLRVEETYQGK